MKNSEKVGREAEWQTREWIHRRLRVGPWALMRLFAAGKVRTRVAKSGARRGIQVVTLYSASDVRRNYVRRQGPRPDGIPAWQLERARPADRQAGRGQPSGCKPPSSTCGAPVLIGPSRAAGPPQSDRVIR